LYSCIVKTLKTKQKPNKTTTYSFGPPTTEEKKSLIDFKLRPWQMSDAESCAKQANNPLVAKYLRDVFPSPYSVDDAKSFITYCQGLDLTRNIAYCIEVDGKAVGSIGVFCLNDVYRKTAEIGYWLGQDYWRHGIMSRAVKQICEEAFQKLDIVRIEAKIFAPNEGSQAVLRKSGFMLEGVLRSSVFKNGTIMDSCAYALIRK